MDSSRDPKLTSTKLMLYQLFHSHEQHLQSIKPMIGTSNFNDYSNITKGPSSKKNHLKKERKSEIEAENMILLEKLYNILSVSSKPRKATRIGSLNYPKRKKEFGRINMENKNLYKSILDAKPSVNLTKISKWNESMDKYRKNISNSNRRADPFRPILTHGVASQYPELRVRTSSIPSRPRKLSAEVPNADHFSNLLDF